MSTHDQKFFDVFIMVIGSLVAITITLIFIARSVGAATQTQWVHEYPVYGEQVAKRLKPAGSAAVPGDAAATPPSAGEPAAGAVASTTEPVAATLSGSEVFNQACNTCHGPGIAGAPKNGDKAAWAARIAQGNATLYKHALEGFQGAAGVMPPKGGWANLSAAEITAAVDYMVSQSL